MSNQVKTAYVAGLKVARGSNPVGDNVIANFGRGFAFYFTDEEYKAKRTASIQADKAAFKEYALQNL